MRPVHSGIQQNTEFDWNNLELRCDSPPRAPLFQHFTKFSWPFSVVLFVLLGAYSPTPTPPPFILLKMNWSEYGLNTHFSILLSGAKGYYFNITRKVSIANTV